MWNELYLDTLVANCSFSYCVSWSIADGGRTSPKPETTTTVIETKPPTTNPPLEIKPSKAEVPPKSLEKKPIVEKEKESPKKSSQVEIKVSPPTAAVYSSIVEVRGGPSQEKTPEIYSKVEVRGGPASVKSDVISTKVEVKVAPSSVVEVKSIEVNIVGGFDVNAKKKLPEPIVNVKVGDGVPKPVAILSSKVEVISSSDEPAISGNNLDGPAEYDFLSRQPSEVVDETYRVRQ